MTGTPCASSKGWRPCRTTNPSAGEPSSGTVQSKSFAKRARACKRVQIDERVERVAECGRQRAQLVGQVSENAIHLSPFLGFELPDPIPCLDGRRRLDEERGAAGRSVLHDPPDDGAAFSSNGDDVSPVAHGHRRVADLVVRLEARHDALEQCDQFALRPAQLAPHAAKERRRFVSDRPILGDRAINASLGIDFPYESLSQVREDGARHERPTLVVQYVPRSPAGSEQRQRPTQLAASPDGALDAEPVKGPHEIGSCVWRPGMVGRAQHAGGADACELVVDGGPIGSGLEVLDAVGGERRDRAFCDERQCPRQFQDIQRVSVHDRTLCNVTRVPRAPRARWY